MSVFAPAAPRPGTARGVGWGAVTTHPRPNGARARDDAGRTGPGGAPAPDEAALVERARRGEQAAFEALVHRHADRLHAVVLRFVAGPEEAEEVTQETFLRAWRGIARFEGRSQFFTWLYRIAVNEARRRAERRRWPARTLPVDDREADRIADPGDPPAARAEQNELRAALEHAVRRLPIKYRAPVILRDVEGLTTAEAAAVMELGEAAFKSRLHRGRMAVRKAIDGYLAEPPR
jgi:RNA polymerase sigma-70 factor, ECF subfamily